MPEAASAPARAMPGAPASPGWRFPAEVRFANARETVEAASSALDSPVPRFDLSGCERFDSSLIAALLELARRAARDGRECRFESPSENLLKLASLYGVDALLFAPALASALAEVRAAAVPTP